MQPYGAGTCPRWKFGLEAEQLWDACESANLDAEVVREQVSYGPGIF